MKKLMSKLNRLSRTNKILIVSGIFAVIMVNKLHTANFVNEFLFAWGMSFAMFNLITDSANVGKVGKVGKAVCEKIIVETLFDEKFYPDYLEQFKDSKNPEEQKYFIEDKKRLEDFNNHKWYAVGIKAVAVIKIGNGPSIVQYINSGGLWGIESDSEPSHFEEIKKEQIEEVKNYLRILNVEKIDEAPIEYKEKLF